KIVDSRVFILSYPQETSRQRQNLNRNIRALQQIAVSITPPPLKKRYIGTRYKINGGINLKNKIVRVIKREQS
ncbi:MAG: hypothetical protein ACXQS6_05485, partial [Candidatus Syntropharchaeales archaeon]